MTPEQRAAAIERILDKLEQLITIKQQKGDARHDKN